MIEKGARERKVNSLRENILQTSISHFLETVFLAPLSNFDHHLNNSNIYFFLASKISTFNQIKIINSRKTPDSRIIFTLADP